MKRETRGKRITASSSSREGEGKKETFPKELGHAPKLNYFFRLTGGTLTLDTYPSPNSRLPPTAEDEWTPVCPQDAVGVFFPAVPSLLRGDGARFVILSVDSHALRRRMTD